MNEVLEAIRSRRSIRKYKPDMVPREIIDQIATAGSFAASGMGKQSPVIIAVTDKELRDKLSAANAQILGTTADPFYGAPAVLVVLADKSCPTHVYDGSLVMGNLMLAAQSLGIGTCWIHRAKEVFEGTLGKEILKRLDITGNYEGIGFCILGYPEGDRPGPRPRKADYIYHID